MSITIQLSSDQEAALRRKAKQAGKAIEQYVESLLSNQLEEANPPRAALSPGETALLDVINRGFPEPFWQRYRELFDKKEDETLSESEYGELLAMVEQVEAYTVERLRALIVLAELRGTDLDTVMRQLGLYHAEESF